MRIFAVANQKGGVGKTTTTISLGAALAERGKRVLIVDLDPQGNATTGLGVDGRQFERSVYDVLLNDVPMVDIVEPTGYNNLFVAPATLDLAGVEQELTSVISRELRLKRAIDLGGGGLRLHLHRLSPVAWAHNDQRVRRRDRDHGSRSDRVLRA